MNTPAADGTVRRLLASDIRLQKDLEDMELPPRCSLRQVPLQNLSPRDAALGASVDNSRASGTSTENPREGKTSSGVSARRFTAAFVFSLTPSEGYWHGGHFTFDVRIPEDYPHRPPKVRCRERVSETSRALGAAAE